MVLFSTSFEASEFSFAIDEETVSDMLSIESSPSDGTEKMDANAAESSASVDMSSLSKESACG
jgi:hypothetical protein